MGQQLRMACQEDLDNIRRFIHRAGLPVEGIQEVVEYFVLLENDEKQLKLTIGLEPVGKHGIVRSLAFAAEISEQDLQRAVQKLMTIACDQGLEELYLVTNKNGASSFLELLGFQVVEKGDLPVSLHTSRHVSQFLHEEKVQWMKQAVSA